MSLRFAAAAAAAVAVTAQGAAPTPPFAPADQPVQQARVVAGAHPRSGRYEYVVTGDALVAYVEGTARVVERVELPALTTVPRGLDVDVRRSVLYIAYGGQGGEAGTGTLLKYDLLRDRVAWQKAYPAGVDSFALSRDGQRIFMPGGEGDPAPWWYVLRTSDGAALARIDGGAYAHNTVVSLDGRHVYLGARGSMTLAVADARTYRVVRRVGPFRGGVRPFTIDRSQALAFTTATGFRGFQVASITTGRVLYTVDFGPVPPDFALTAPSHGISLSPDERQLWVVDRPSRSVRVYDISKLPHRPPREVASLACAADADPPGWVQHTLDGKYVYVGNSGDVFGTKPLRHVATLPALRESRLSLEIDWRRGRVVATSTRVGLGRR